MYLAISYGLGLFTVLAVLALLWLGWENRLSNSTQPGPPIGFQF